MDSLIFAPHIVPFTVALGLLFGLMLLELIAALIGGSLLGLGGEPELDIGFEADLDVDIDFDLDATEALDVDATDMSAGTSDWLGLGQVPTLIWVGAFLLVFGLGGLLLQTGAQNVIGTGLPTWIAVPVAALAGVGFARRFSKVFARLLPKSESSAMSERHLGRSRGIISRGTAARGRPAEVRVTDRFGNTHYLRAEPLRDDQQFAQGTKVLVLRRSIEDGYRLIDFPE